MHTFALAFFTMSFDYGLVAGKTVTIAAAVFSILQVVKKYTNWSFLQGRWAIVANIAFNIVAVLATTMPSQLFSMGTLVQILTGVFLASGLHGVVTTVVPSTGGVGDPDNPTNKAKTESPKP